MGKDEKTPKGEQAENGLKGTSKMHPLQEKFTDKREYGKGAPPKKDHDKKPPEGSGNKEE